LSIGPRESPGSIENLKKQRGGTIMADKVLPESVEESAAGEAVCIHTRKVFDSCRDKDCIEDLRVFVTTSSLPYIDAAFSVRPRSAELLYADVGAEELSFKKGYYAVDVTCFYKVTGETFPGSNTVEGLAIFDKRVVLYGSEGSARIFTSDGAQPGVDQPVAVVETVDPLLLGMKLVDPGCFCGEAEVLEVPDFVMDAFGDSLDMSSGSRQLRATLGQFSIIRLERDVRILVPSYDYCYPDKECAGGDQDDPCALFSQIPFPVDEFFPPDNIETSFDYRTVKNDLN